MKSIGQMIKQIDGLRGTQDVTPWQDEFIGSVVARSLCGERTAGLSEKQIEIIEKIYERHFV